MTETNKRIPTEDSFCFGRDLLAAEIVTLAFETGAVLLLGGRQSGKTTILRKIKKNLSQNRGRADDMRTMGLVDLPIYVNLMRLPYDAKPDDFFRMLLILAWKACQQQIDNCGECRLISQGNTEVTLDIFSEDLRRISNAAGNILIRFLFLLDEVKRVLGARFPRGFQDNLFALLYDDDIGLVGKCAMVFSGAQELYTFSVDETSPIGSRAAKCLLLNLEQSAIIEAVNAVCGSIAKEVASKRASEIYALTGGHAGLSIALAKRYASFPEVEVEIKNLLPDFAGQRSELFQIWLDSLSPEARVIQDYLLSSRIVQFRDLARLLHEKGMLPHKIDRACEELLFTGLARRTGDSVEFVNFIYADAIKMHVINNVCEEDVQKTIGEVLKDLTIGEKVGNWILRRRLGEGGMGRIYLGENPQIGHRVAIKFLLQKYIGSGDFVGRMQREATILAGIRHPGIIHIIDFSWYPPQQSICPYIVMDYIEGNTLATIMIDVNRIALRKVLNYARQISAALIELNVHGVVHRDLKPSNIMITADHNAPCGERVVLIDFGIAKLPPGMSYNIKTRAGEMLGTDLYNPPEQIRDAASVGPSADIYNFGQIIKQLLNLAIVVNTASRESLIMLADRMTSPEPNHRPSASQVSHILAMVKDESEA